MAQPARTSKTLLGCGLGCGGAMVLLVGGCFAFQAWLKSPGEFLEPTAMLDPLATTYVACRLDLEEAPTREFVDQTFAAAQRSSDQLRGGAGSPVVDFLARWNENRQRRDLIRLFPISAAWVVWPGERDTASVGALLISARGMSHQVMFMDWVLGIVAGRASTWPTHRIAGERVYEVPLGPGDPLYAFLDSRGVVVCLDRDSVAPAAERLRRDRATPRARRAPSELERWLARVPPDLPLRGAVLDRQGEVAQLLAWLAPGADRAGWERSWDPIEAATVAGRFTGGGSILVTLDLAVDPATEGPRRELLLADLQRYFGEHWDAGRATVRPSEQGVTLELLVDELPHRLEELHVRRSSAGSRALAGSRDR
jgi:hypothetical protein